ncbi:aldo/keto reductase [Bifidobacterium choloepi]|uniref:L-glyceraldehyde 3-phosphate reductase n=1 Tax=Bifidobacterium choloepi TaxID=2614131 RepID=A0A6I5N7D7_9BIFI|nr:aldo/keto reductase [Bifidobacterium choloepi]NEG69761.1 L-glyceraldehyde 3-phosphate reductase [Bifidobacterium choloepi]
MLEQQPPYVAAEDRYDKLEYRRCGDSGLKLPPVSFGLWHNFGDLTPMAQMKSIIFTAFDNGITYFDIADNYGPEPGQAERNFGEILHRHMARHRDEMVISSKAGYEMWFGPYGDLGSRKHLLAGLDQSLQRLGLDYVDIFYHHHMDSSTPLEETMGALAQAVHSGKALYVGLSNYDGPTMAKAAEMLHEMHVPFIINQNRYNILDRTVEHNGLLDACGQLGKGLVTFSPLEQGLLTDRYLNGIPADSRIAHDPRFLSKADLTESRLQQIRDLNAIAADRGQTLAEMAVAWLLAHKEVTSVLVGASKPSQVLDDLRGIQNTTFSDDELAKIDEIAGR